MKSAQILKQKVNSSELTLGVIVTMHFWLELVELVKNAGLDYLIIDTEHTAWDEERVAHACALGRMIDFPILIRPPETERYFVRLAVDKGACGLLLPYVESKAALDEARDGLFMPPRGKRRPGGPGNRWSKDLHYRTWRETVEDHFIVLPQIESKKGLDNVDEIVRHEITTAVAVGPYDLSADLGLCWHPDHPSLLDAISRVRNAARAVGKNIWMVGDGPTWITRGLTFLCIGEPTYILEMALANHVTALRAQQAAAAKG